MKVYVVIGGYYHEGFCRPDSCYFSIESAEKRKKELIDKRRYDFVEIEEMVTSS